MKSANKCVLNPVDVNDEYAMEDMMEKVAPVQWNSYGSGIYSVAKPTVKHLPPGMYQLQEQMGELLYIKQQLSVDGVFETGSMNAKEIINDCDKFWDMKEKFSEYGVPHRRGLLLSGVPGSGKTCLIKLIAQTLIEKRKGVLLDCRGALYYVAEGIKSIRKIQKNMPIIVVMEDLDHYDNDVSGLLNVMDGLGIIESVMFIATTNSVKTLDKALINRPGRFDVHYKVMPAVDKVRETFILGLITDDDRKKINIKQWVKDTKNLPFGHIRELVISVMVFGKDYKTTLNRLYNMTEGQEETEDNTLEN